MINFIKELKLQPNNKLMETHNREKKNEAYILLLATNNAFIVAKTNV